MCFSEKYKQFVDKQGENQRAVKGLVSLFHSNGLKSLRGKLQSWRERERERGIEWPGVRETAAVTRDRQWVDEAGHVLRAKVGPAKVCKCLASNEPQLSRERQGLIRLERVRDQLDFTGIA